MEEKINLVDSAKHVSGKLNHECFPQPVDSSVRVWRYLDLAKFIWLLENRKLYLSRLDTLEDLHEGSIPKFQADQFEAESTNHILAATYKRLVEEHGSELALERLQTQVPQIVNQVQQLMLYKKELRKTSYVNCWHLNNSESEAMWRLYCPSDNGVAIQTTYKKLVESTMIDPEVYVGCVKYLDYESQGFPINNVFYSVMHKRLSFAHENEVRLVKLKGPENWGTSQEFSAEGISLDWQPDSVIDAIYVDPYAPNYYYDVVRTIVSKISPELAGRVVWSKMRTDPVY